MTDQDRVKEKPGSTAHDVVVPDYHGIGVDEQPRLRDPKRNRKRVMPGGGGVATLNPDAGDDHFGID